LENATLFARFFMLYIIFGLEKNQILQIPIYRAVEQLSNNACHREAATPCCGARQKLRLAQQACFMPTAVTRSAPLIRHWRRSHRSPWRSGVYFQAVLFLEIATSLRSSQ
jgi:hypothetical protein